MQSLRFVFMVVDSKKVPHTYSMVVLFHEVLGTTNNFVLQAQQFIGFLNLKSNFVIVYEPFG